MPSDCFTKTVSENKTKNDDRTRRHIRGQKLRYDGGGRARRMTEIRYFDHGGDDENIAYTRRCSERSKPHSDYEIGRNPNVAPVVTIGNIKFRTQ